VPKDFAGVMHEWGAGQLHSGGSGQTVPHTPAGQKQAVAIAFSEARKLGSPSAPTAMTYPPHIKASHVGELHDDLGIPRDQKIPYADKVKAAHSSNPAEAKRGQFALNFNDAGHHGEVVGISKEYSRHHGKDYVEVTVAHGKRTTHNTDGTANHYDDRPKSRVLLPKGHPALSGLTVGQKGGVGVSPLYDGSNGDTGSGSAEAGPGGEGDEDSPDTPGEGYEKLDTDGDDDGQAAMSKVRRGMTSTKGFKGSRTSRAY